VSVVRRKIDFALAGHMARRKDGGRPRHDRSHDRRGDKRRGRDKKRGRAERNHESRDRPRAGKGAGRNHHGGRPKKKRR
jgi:hypothetical protein